MVKKRRMKMSEIIKVTKGELDKLDSHSKYIEEQNRKMIQMRKRTIFNALATSNHLRVNTSKNISKWIEILSERIFDPQTITEMDENKIIALFKYINNLNLKVLAESGNLEKVLQQYIESGTMESAEKIDEVTANSNNKTDELRYELMMRLNNLMKKNLVDAEIVSKEEIIDVTPIKDEDLQALDNLSEEIDEIKPPELEDVDL